MINSQEGLPAKIGATKEQIIGKCWTVSNLNMETLPANSVYNTQWPLWLVLENPCTSKQWQIHTIYQLTYMLLQILDIAFL